MNWELVSSNDADDDKRGFIQHQVFFNNNGTIQPLVQARWPDIPYTKATTTTYADVAHMAKGSGHSYNVTVAGSPIAWFTNDNSHISMPDSIRNALPGALITYQPATMCFSRTNRIPSSGAFDNRDDSVEDEITMKAEYLKSENQYSTSTFYGQYNYNYLNIGCGYHIWGKKDFLDAPGEWFREPDLNDGGGDNGTLYVWMPDNQAPGDRIEAKRRMQTVIIGNMNESENPNDTTRDGIVLENLTFLGGGISVSRNSDNLTIRGCTFLYASWLEDQRFTYTARWDRRSLLLAASGALIENCNFYHCETGIELNGRNNIVRNCVFRYIGVNSLFQAIKSHWQDCLSNDGSLAQRNLVEHCTFLDTAYTAIQLSKGLDVKYNDVSGTHRRGNDTGAISLAPNTDAMGAEVAYNFVHDSWPMPRNMENGCVFYGAHGIYNDRGSSNITIHHNVVWNMSGPEIGILPGASGSGDSNRYWDHNTVDGSMDIASESGKLNTTVRNNLAESFPASASSITLIGNYGYKPGSAGWVNEAAHDYHLLPTSPAIDRGEDITSGGGYYQTYPPKQGAKPDAGAYEGTGLWEKTPGAFISEKEIASLNFTFTTDVEGNFSANVTGFPIGRGLPHDFKVIVPGQSGGGTIFNTINATTGEVVATITNIPTGGLTGNQTISVKIGNGDAIQVGTANLDTLAIYNIENEVTKIVPWEGGINLTLNGKHFSPSMAHLYSRNITISNPSNTDLYSYPILVILDTASIVTAGKMQSDGRDIRFTWNGNDLDYWIETGTMNTNATRIWVKIPKIEASGTSFQMSYGDSSRTAKSDGTKTFAFYDGFDSGSLNPSFWTTSAPTVNASTSNVTVSNGQLVLSGNQVNGEVRPWAALPDSSFENERSKTLYPTGSFIIESKVQVVKSGGQTNPPSLNWLGHFGHSNQDSIMAISSGKIAYYLSGSGWKDPETGGSPTVSTGLVNQATVTIGYAIYDISGSNATVAHYENGSYKSKRLNQQVIHSSGYPNNRGKWAFNPRANGEFEVRIDDVRIRPWVPNEPTTSVGSEVQGNPLRVLVNNVDATNVTYVNSNKITFTLPAFTGTYADLPKPVDVKVILPDGKNTTLANGIEYRDLAPPVWLGNLPQVDTITKYRFRVRGKINEEGTLYYVVVTDNATPPTSEEVKAGVDYRGVTVVQSGNITLQANTESSCFVNGLSRDTAYDVYIVAEDKAKPNKNIQTTPQKFDVTTPSSDTMIWDGEANDGAWGTQENWHLNLTPDEWDVARFSSNATVNITTSSKLKELVLDPGRSLSLGGTSNLTISSSVTIPTTSSLISHATLEGSATVSLSGTFINNGTLSTPTLIIQTGGHFTANGTVNSNITVQSGGMMTGSGNLTESVTLSSGGTLNPGSDGTLGTLSFQGNGARNLTLAGTLALDYSGSSGCDTIEGIGDLNLSGCTLSLTNIGAQLTANQSYTILTYNGTRTSSFVSVPGGVNVEYDVDLGNGWKGVRITIVVYLISYDANGGSGTIPVGTKFHDVPYVLSDGSLLSRIGYTLVRWNTSQDGTGISYNLGANYTTNENVTLYAQWTPNTYLVTFDKQGGSAGSDNVTATYDAEMPSATAPTRTGYTFGGYFTAPNGGGTKYYNADMSSAATWNITNNTTLYAKWTPNTYL
ncbi:MAG: DUF2341 domain-containing protein, partial [Candidatus Methanomethylicaceae archaeon]